MSAALDEYLSDARELREEGNECFSCDEFSGAILYFSEAIALIDELEVNECVIPYHTNTENIPLAEIISLRLALHSSLAETYLRLGMGYKAKEHCGLALFLDEENDKVNELLNETTLAIKHQKVVTSEIRRVIKQIQTTKASGQLKAMVDAARVLPTLAPANTCVSKIAPVILVEAILAQAESELFLAKSVYQELESLGVHCNAACVSAMSHFDRSVGLSQEAASISKPYCEHSRGFGFDSTDVSINAYKSCWRATFSFAAACFMQGRVHEKQEIIRARISLHSYIDIIGTLNDEDRRSMRGRFSLARLCMFKGVESLQSLSSSDNALFFLKEVRTFLVVQLSLRINRIDWMSLDFHAASERAESIAKLINNADLQGMSAELIGTICQMISCTLKRLFVDDDVDERNYAAGGQIPFLITNSLLSSCTKGYTVAGEINMQIRALRSLIRERRKFWMIKPVPNYSPSSEEESNEDRENISQLIAALERTGCEVGQECPICLEPLLGVGVINPLSCDHMFHNECCKQYFNEKVSSEDMHLALKGNVVTKQLPCVICRQIYTMRIFRDGSFMEVAGADGSLLI